MKLKRSNDRKVTNAVSPNGKTPTIANTFGLPLERLSRVLVPLTLVKLYATQENLKEYTKE